MTVDLENLRDRVAAVRERLATANADNRRLYEALEPVVGSYCPGLARTPYHIHRYYGTWLESSAFPLSGSRPRVSSVT